MISAVTGAGRNFSAESKVLVVMNNYRVAWLRNSLVILGMTTSLMNCQMSLLFIKGLLVDEIHFPSESGLAH